MAKPFNYPRIKELAVAESQPIFGDPSAIKRSADAFGKRNGRRFAYEVGVDYVRVTRLPDPAPEQSEAA